MTGAAAGLQSYIADGFTDDCDELILQCLKETPVTFRTFSTVFKKMQMSCVFHDRNLGAEIAELSEEVINIAKYYMLANTSNFEETVIGLFLVYSMVTIQPFTNFALLRLVDEDVPLIVHIEQIARREKRLDVLYVLGRLLVEYTRYHAAARERGMESTYRKYLEGCPTIESFGPRPKGVLLRQNEELDIIKELSGLQLRYDDAKADIKAVDLNYIDAKFPSELESSLSNIVSGIIHSAPTVDNGDVQDTARIIKERAMKTKVDGIKYLMGVNERQSAKSDVVSNSNVQNSQDRTKATKTAKRNNLVIQRKRKRNYSSESNESDTPTESENDNDSADIDLVMFDKEKSDSKSRAGDEIEIDANNIKFEKLPCMITCVEDGQAFEIEIIDELKSSNPESSNKSKDKAKSINSGRNVDKTRPRKQNFKKTILRSRFKRMGMDSVAFE